MSSVSGRSRVAYPAARIRAFMSSPYPPPAKSAQNRRGRVANRALRWRRVAGGTLLPTRVGMWWRFGGLRSLVPRGEVLLLLRGQLVLLDAHRRQLQARDLGVDLLGHVVDLPLERRRVLDDELGRKRLVRE